MNINTAIISLLFTFLLTISTVSANHGVFNVKYKFADDQQRSLSVLKAHDYRRQMSLITGVDLPLGGTGRPDSVGCSLFHTSIFTIVFENFKILMIDYELVFCVCVYRLYYAKIGIGTPSKDYYLQVDTGTDMMWVNCIQCKECPTRSNLGVCFSFTFFLSYSLCYSFNFLCFRNFRRYCKPYQNSHIW